MSICVAMALFLVLWLTTMGLDATLAQPALTAEICTAAAACTTECQACASSMECVAAFTSAQQSVEEGVQAEARAAAEVLARDLQSGESPHLTIQLGKMVEDAVQESDCCGQAECSALYSCITPTLRAAFGPYGPIDLEPTLRTAILCGGGESNGPSAPPTFTVGSGSCTTSDDGHCVRSPHYPGNYGNNEWCTIHASGFGVLSTNHFFTEDNVDYLRIGDARYSGMITSSSSATPTGALVSADVSISWHTDNSAIHTGFEVCVELDCSHLQIGLTLLLGVIPDNSVELTSDTITVAVSDVEEMRESCTAESAESYIDMATIVWIVILICCCGAASSNPRVVATLRTHILDRKQKGGSGSGSDDGSGNDDGSDTVEPQSLTLICSTWCHKLMSCVRGLGATSQRPIFMSSGSSCHLDEDPNTTEPDAVDVLDESSECLTEEMFERFDADGDGFLSQAECRAAATALFPGEDWEEELWPALCEAYGADPTKGMDVAQFGSFVQQAEEANAGAARTIRCSTRIGRV